MVSKASEDFPEPDRPVNTTSLSRGISTSIFFRLCSRAPRMTIARKLDWPVCWRCLALITSSISAVPGAFLSGRDAERAIERQRHYELCSEHRKNERQFPASRESHQRN